MLNGDSEVVRDRVDELLRVVLAVRTVDAARAIAAVDLHPQISWERQHGGSTGGWINPHHHDRVASGTERGAIAEGRVIRRAR